MSKPPASPAPEGLRGSRHRRPAWPGLLVVPVMFTVLANILVLGQALVPRVPARPAGFAAGELLVKFDGGPLGYPARAAHAEVGSQVQRNYLAVGWQLVRLPAGLSVVEGMEAYRRRPGVQAVEPNHLRAAGVVPSDPGYAEQWAMETIHAPAAWDLATGSPDVVIALIDSGVRYDHEDLAANLWRNPGESGPAEDGSDRASNGVDDDENGYVDDVFGIDAHNRDSDPADDFGHGTACASILGAVGNNSVGLAGVSWSVRIMPLKYLGADGFGRDADAIECFEYVVAMKRRGVNIRITNNSYGGDENGQAIRDAIDLAGSEGVLNVFCAKNEARDNDVFPVYPASFDSPSIVSVAATDRSDGLASFSNYGRSSVDLAAPGVAIPVFDHRTSTSAIVPFVGTSAAAPQVAGAAALLLARAPTLEVAALKALLLGSVDPIAGLSNKVVANGRLNVARALEAVGDASGPPLIVACAPVANRVPADARLVITFSQAMDRSSVESAVSVSPPVSGAFAWSGDSTTVTFTPAQPLAAATSYRVTVAGSAQSSTGAGLDGNFNRAAQGTTLDDFTWGFRRAPANDDLEQATSIEGSGGTVTSSNQNATRQAGEPVHADNPGGASIWFRWTAPASGPVTFDTFGTAFDTVLAVYRESSSPAQNATIADASPDAAGDPPRLAGISTLVPVAAADDYGTLRTSRVSFSAQAGAAYAIAVDGKVFEDVLRDAPGMGAAMLNWYPTPPPVFGEIEFEPATGAAGSAVILSGTNLALATEVWFGDVRAAFVPAMGAYADLHLIAVIPDDAQPGPVTIVTPAGRVTSARSFEVTFLPRLKISRLAAGGVRVRWPVAAGDYLLEHASLLGAEVPWAETGATPTLEGSDWVVEFPATDLLRYYRLRQR